ncbi:YesL family protein [Metabacillus bambusae]|uniref:DUF624 domain-containing protein n=1 Tax=Metabacillus bambusae TaxID=2795218 RepID=A0ABS3NAE0_9BACI|nr:DUF624 domain-containing protein [Metabacillus bambusae]MBO1515249.1 DUF624 domain-containing protein [Metabacillus bambusae]
MNVMNGKFTRVLELLSNFFLLNLIWLLMCLPIVTIFPATAAMFGVVRQWILHDDTAVFTVFMKYFKENFKQSMVIGILWGFFAFILYMNFTLMLQLGAMKFILLPFVVLFSVLMVFTTVYIFPVMVHYKLKVFGVIRNSFLLSMSFLPSSLLATLVLVGMFVLFLWQPFTVFISFSVGGYLIFTLCNKVFTRKENYN